MDIPKGSQKMDDLKFFYKRYKNLDGSTSPRGGITIAYTVKDEFLLFAEAHCHPKDNFNKHTGRAKSAGRFKSNTWRTSIPIKPEENPIDILNSLCKLNYD